MEHIVIGLDEETASQSAVDWVLERARIRPLSVELVTLFDMLTSDPLDDEKRLRSTRERMEKARPDLIVATSIVEKSIYEGLIERSRTADLLVLGSHPRTWIESAFAGALPVRIAARAHCPTVLVPDDWAARRGGVVVAGVGDDHSADRAIPFAAREATDSREELELVHAWEIPAPIDLPAGGVLIDPDELRDAHREILRDVVDRTKAAFPQARIVGVLAEGRPGNQVISRMSRSALIVLGTHGHGPVSGLILGSTLQEVLRVGKVPVCVVPL